MYLLLEEVGSGAAGTAHLAVRSDERTDELFVVKQLRPQIAEQPEHLSRFKHEASIAVMVDHPNVVEVVDVGLGAERPYIVMRYVEGPTLAAFMNALEQNGRTLSVPAAVGLVRDALAGLQALHEAKHPETGEPLGFVHRDLSPRNLIVTRSGPVRLIDLGLGRSRLGDWQTEAGRIMGSIGYMPPEQLRAQGVDHRTDLWSIACVLFELITLEPYVRGHGRERLMNTMREEPRSLRTKRPDVPAALDDVIQRALSATPAARFESAASFSRALAETCPADAPGEAAALVEALFGEALDERRHRLLEVALTVVQPLEITEAYERIASRPGAADPESFATFDATRVVADPTRVDPEAGRFESVPPVPPPPAATPPRQRTVWIAAAVGVLVGAATVTAVLGPSPSSSPAPIERPQPAPRVEATPVIEPRVAEVPEPVRRTRSRPRRTAPRAADTTVAKAPEPAKPAPVRKPEAPSRTPRERAAQLQKRLQRLREGDAERVDRLLMELTALDLVTDARRYERALERIEREVAALD